MWKIINSPIIVAVVCIFVIGFMIRPAKLKVASEIRGAYEELMNIAEEGADDAEKAKVIYDFIEELAKQVRTGFSAGFKTPDSEKKISEDKIFVETQNMITVSDINIVETRHASREEFMFKIKNNSEQYIKQVRVNIEFYKENKLIDCRNLWINEIKVLEPGKEIILKKLSRSLCQNTGRKNSCVVRFDQSYCYKLQDR